MARRGRIDVVLSPAARGRVQPLMKGLKGSAEKGILKPGYGRVQAFLSGTNPLAERIREKKKAQQAARVKSLKGRIDPGFGRKLGDF